MYIEINGLKLTLNRVSTKLIVLYSVITYRVGGMARIIDIIARALRMKENVLRS